MRTLFLMLLMGGLLAPPAAPAQVKLGPQGPVRVDPENPDKPLEPPSATRQNIHIFRLTIDPAAEPQPALKYSFVPGYLEKRPGNSVPYYYRALISLLSFNDSQQAWKPFYENYEQWMNGPLDEFPAAEVQAFLRRFTTAFEQLQTAAYREKTDWDWRLKELEREEPISFLLPEIQEMRSLARLLSLRARVEIVQGRYEDAIGTLRLGYQLGRDTAQQPLLINGLVGIAIVGMMNERVIELIDASKSPNLYWALTALPDPPIDWHEAMRHEVALPALMFPELRDPETARRSPEQWADLVTEVLRETHHLDGNLMEGIPPEPRWLSQVAATALVLKGYSRAKEELRASGYSAEQIESMPVGQVVMIYQAHIYRHVHDEMLKWALLPPGQAYERIDIAEEQLKEAGYLAPAGQSREIIPLSSALMPAIHSASGAYLTMQVRLRALRTLEAIRMHAAVDDNGLPQSLEEIKVVPVPNHPVTGHPFPYRRQGETAVLEVVVFPQDPSARYNWRFEIQLDRQN